jgi:hypothetical protein
LLDATHRLGVAVARHSGCSEDGSVRRSMLPWLSIRRPASSGLRWRPPRHFDLGESMSRILVFDPRDEREQCARELAHDGLDLVVCQEREALLESFSERRPDAIVYVLGEWGADRCVLSMLRRVAPNLPMILVGGPAGIDARRAVQELRPTYYAVFPLEPLELCNAIRGALDRRR